MSNQMQQMDMLIWTLEDDRNWFLHIRMWPGQNFKASFDTCCYRGRNWPIEVFNAYGAIALLCTAEGGWVVYTTRFMQMLA